MDVVVIIQNIHSVILRLNSTLIEYGINRRLPYTGQIQRD